MNFLPKKPPRKFKPTSTLEISDCGTVTLDHDEQVTFTTESGSEWDVIRKDWGYYATPSINGRLSKMGLKAALVKNSFNKYYILLCEPSKIAEFRNYLESEQMELVLWLDDEETLAKLEKGE
ncbi:hypothetical protein K8I28_15100 [bacterium]|nr:hypothetical protein [bacterium]